MKKPDQWDSALYDDRHSFVWKAGAGLVDLLQAVSGERILDLGCGTGHLTAQIAASGADVTGMDASPSMVAQARQNFPRQKFILDDARSFTVAELYDAVFSNAALHWIPEASRVIDRVAAALKPGGRFVLEMGARHNIQRIHTTLESVLRERGLAPVCPWFYPSTAQYATLLEERGFEVRFASTFPRWTRLEHPERGLREWLEMFAQPYLKIVPPGQLEGVFHDMETHLRPELYCDGAWYADYRRLRVVAIKEAVRVPSPEL